MDQVVQAGVKGQRPTLVVQLNEEIFTLPPGHIEVSLLPELVTLAEVAAEVVLVLHHILGETKYNDITKGSLLRIQR